MTFANATSKLLIKRQGGSGRWPKDHDADPNTRAGRRRYRLLGRR
jgi:hypothetical protein